VDPKRHDQLAETVADLALTCNIIQGMVACRNAAIETLYVRHGLTAAAIGRIAGLSRERIGQLTRHLNRPTSEES